MTARPLWQVSVTTSKEAEDAVSAWLETTLAAPACAYADADGDMTTVTVCLARRPAWKPLRLELSAGLSGISACGLNIAPGRIRLVKLPPRNWVLSWKRHFRPLAIGSALLLKPSWSRRRPQQGQAEVVLDPGLSFGTGRHPTTAFCLEQLVARRHRREGRSFLDVGFGSGILAIAAAKLGYGPIEAVDSDPQTLEVAAANARRNRVAAAIRFRRLDVARLPRVPARRFWLVCANLTADLLLAHRHRLVAQVEPGGILVLAGILKTEFPNLRAAFEADGLKLAASTSSGEWRSAAFACRG